jgi:hypothetical protein
MNQCFLFISGTQSRPTEAYLIVFGPHTSIRTNHYLYGTDHIAALNYGEPGAHSDVELHRQQASPIFSLAVIKLRPALRGELKIGLFTYLKLPSALIPQVSCPAPVVLKISGLDHQPHRGLAGVSHGRKARRAPTPRRAR